MVKALWRTLSHLIPKDTFFCTEMLIVWFIQVDGYVKIFPKVVHGWTVRYSVEDEAAVKRAEEAHENLLEWFSKYVK